MQLKFDFHVHTQRLFLPGYLYSVAIDFWCNFDFVAVIWYHRSNILSGRANSCIVNLFLLCNIIMSIFFGVLFAWELLSPIIWRVFILRCKWLHLQMSRMRTCFNCNLFGLFYRQKKTQPKRARCAMRFSAATSSGREFLHTQKTATKECTNNNQEEVKKAKRDLWSLSSM